MNVYRKAPLVNVLVGFLCGIVGENGGVWESIKYMAKWGVSRVFKSHFEGLLGDHSESIR